jgi:fengycin family lipopeptide synthetase C
MEMVPEDRILYTSSIVFDVTTYEIWGALLNGMTLYVVDKETILDAPALKLFKNESPSYLTSALYTN